VAQNRVSSTNKDSLTVHVANLAEGAVIKESLIAQQRGLSRMSVVKNFFTAAVREQSRYFEQAIAANVAEILGARG